MVFGKRIDKPGGDRRAVREPAMIPAAIMTVTDSLNVDLFDLSRIGARFRHHDLPSPGQEVLVLIGRLEAFGVVVWREHDQCGVRFDVPLSDSAFDLVKAEFGPVAVLTSDPDAWLAASDWQHGLAR